MSSAMATTRSSPVMVEQPSSPPSHPFSNAELTTSTPTTASTRIEESVLTNSASDSTDNHPAEEVTTDRQQGSSDSTQQVPEASTTEVQPVVDTSTHEEDAEEDNSSNSESHSDSSTSTETPGTISTPRSSAHDSGQPVPDSETAPLNSNTEPPTTETSTSDQPESQISQDSTDGLLIPPPPVADIIPVPDPVPSWVLYEEDTSEPSKEELETIEANKNELDASDPDAIERDVFYDVDDPDQRPYKKIRLSWVIKGVRGTKEKPNRSRIMTSPSVCIDGNHWNLKFFPRGNKSRNSLAVFLRCSPGEPLLQSEGLEGSFRCWEGAHDANFSKMEPITDLELKLPEPVEKEEEDTTSTEPAKIDNKSETAHTSEVVPEAAVVVDSDASEVVEERSQTRRRRDSHDDDDSSVSGDEDDRPFPHLNPNTMEDYRLSAQLGLAVYNPAEPRTCYTSSASHQFYPHQDDWGWDTAVSYWEDIHHRKFGQRQALLRNDSLAVDAYIRVYDDPTKALYWHSSPGETQWDAKGLAGVFPVGTRLLYHSPATAGIIAWTMLAPFRKAVQDIDAGVWRKDSAAKPRPLIAHMQLMLFQMRHMKKEELYVRLDNVIHEITRSGESFDNTKAFWEAWRRSLEMETLEDPKMEQALNKIFGNKAQLRNLPLLPIKDVSDFQDSASRAFEKANYKESLPDFLPLTLQRQSFDSTTRQWKLHHDLVKISEEIDLSKQTQNDNDKYTLYGFIVHDGERTSGKFFSVLRPHGPGGKWLVFSDGNGNKIFSYTRKQIDVYRGLEGPELRKASNNRQTIHTAMYIRTSCVSEYLTETFEPCKLASWLKPHLDEAYNHTDDQFTEPEEAVDEEPIDVELFWDRSITGQEGKLDLYKLKSHDKAREKGNRQKFTADRDASIGDVKAKLATLLDVDNDAFKLWAMNHHRLGGVSKGYMYVLPEHSIVRSCLNTSLHLTLWFTMVPQKCELEVPALTENFLKIDGAYIEAPPKPDPPAAMKEAALPTAITDNGEVSNTQVEITGVADHSVAVSDGAAPDEEQRAIEEAIARSLEFFPPASESAVPESNTTSAAPTTELYSELPAAADEEQESVREAVAQTLASTEQTNSQATSESSVNHDEEATVSVPPESTIQSMQSENSVAVVGSSVPVPTEESSRDTTATPPQAVTPSEPMSSVATAPNDSQPNQASIENFFHGEPPLTLIESHDAPLGHGLPPLPVGIPIAIGGDQLLLIQPNTEDISSEDAALISSLIAADLEAAERDGQTVVEETGEAVTDPVAETENEAVESRPTTPRQTVPDVYGFIHIFDAENQKFTAHSAFMVPRDSIVSTVIRKQMAYDEEKSFHLWKRDGTYRTVGVSSESTFQDASLTDCCEVIVGDHLGEAKMEALKAEAKYVDPGQLMRYMAMAQRGHPVSALTSEESIEIAEFGGDYYKGPLVRGQRHGKECYIITQAGDTYEGPLVAGQKSGGKGKMTYQNGDVYDGEWLDDQKHGQGEFVEKRTGNKYVGGFENDKRWGKGVTYWEQADQQAALCQVCYFEEVDALFYKCGHVVACYACAKQCAADSNGCPVCRKPIEAVVKMYRA